MKYPYPQATPTHKDTWTNPTFATDAVLRTSCKMVAAVVKESLRPSIVLCLPQTYQRTAGSTRHWPSSISLVMHERIRDKGVIRHKNELHKRTPSGLLCRKNFRTIVVGPHHTTHETSTVLSTNLPSISRYSPENVTRWWWSQKGVREQDGLE